MMRRWLHRRTHENYANIHIIVTSFSIARAARDVVDGMMERGQSKHGASY